jgi:Phage terminase large subunit
MTTAAACPPGSDATTFAVVINGRVVYDPLPRQLQFHLSTARRPLYGGAAGGGKSKALRWHLYIACMQVPGLKCLLLRRQLKDLERSHEREIPKEVAALNADPENPICEWFPSLHTIRFWNGSLIEFGHCQHEENFQNYLSAEYDLIAFDELVTFTKYQFEMISSRCRTTIDGFTPRVLCATNPGGPEAQWVRQLWIDHEVDLDEYPDYDPADYAYVPAKLTDNHHLNQDEYRRTLMGIPPELRRAYLDGDWDLYIGQFFTEFRRAQHVAPVPVLPAHYPRICGIDWGYAKPGVCLWGVVTSDGQLLIEDEYVFNGPRRNKQLPAIVATEIRRRAERRGIRVRAYYVDPSMDKHEGHGQGESILDTFRKHLRGVIKAENDRVNGWARLRAWLSPMPTMDGSLRPFMQVHRRCAYLTRTLPSLVMREDNPEDLDSDGEDHAADALRYLVMSRPSPRVDEIAPAYPSGSMSEFRALLIAKRKTARVAGSRSVKTHYVH